MYNLVGLNDDSVRSFRRIFKNSQSPDFLQLLEREIEEMVNQKEKADKNKVCSKID